jgi:uncharacterized protein (TIGR03083 family)
VASASRLIACIGSSSSTVAVPDPSPSTGSVGSCSSRSASRHTESTGTPHVNLTPGDNARMPTLHDSRTTYDAAATAFLSLVERLPTDRYAGPGLGSWDLRALVGHTGRSLVTVAEYLTTRADEIDAETPAAYFAQVSRVVGPDEDGAIAARGVAAGAALGEDPLAALRASYDAATAALDGLAATDPVVRTICGGMRVSAYLPTRAFELTVHCLDIAAATGLDFTPPPAALAEALAVATASALELGLGADVLLALTGRRPLPAGCSVVP